MSTRQPESKKSSEDKQKILTYLNMQDEMGELYGNLKTGTVDRKLADGLANIAGKFFTAEKLKLNWAEFNERLSRRAKKKASVA